MHFFNLNDCFSTFNKHFFERKEHLTLNMCLLTFNKAYEILKHPYVSEKVVILYKFFLIF